MPDTIFYIDNDLDNDSIIITHKTAIDSSTIIEIRKGTKYNNEIANDLTYAFSVTISIILLALLFYLLGYSFIKRIIFEFKQFAFLKKNDFDIKNSIENTQPQIISSNNYFKYNASNYNLDYNAIVGILNKRFPFYTTLNTIQQSKFVNRVQEFMNSKTFTILSSEPYKEMPVLISASAIQLTFGLDEYLLPYYKNIVVHLEEYFAHGSFRILAGNVQGNTITISWKHFLQGYGNCVDGCNVGLHEMAHALYFQHMVVEQQKQPIFNKYYQQMLNQCHAAYEHEVTGKKNLYTEYAQKDMQEFWAASVELFFEMPKELYSNYPYVYNAIKELLLQDPLIKVI